MRHYIIAIKNKQSLLEKIFKRTTVEGLDLVDCTLFTRLNYNPTTTNMIYPLWSNKDQQLLETIIKQMNKFIWSYQQDHKGKYPTLKNIKRELNKSLKHKGYTIKDDATYYDIKMELIDKE